MWERRQHERNKELFWDLVSPALMLGLVALIVAGLASVAGAATSSHVAYVF